MTWFGIGALVVVAVVLALPFLADRRRGLPDQRRAPGDMVPLPQGATHALWHGPARGPVIVAIHGLTTPSPVWDALAERLGAIGYRVLVYDLYGRGYSDNARGEQGPDFFVRQLKGLLDHHALTEDVTLLGYSMGGAIATAFSAAHPERIKRLILLAPAGVEVNDDRAQRFVRETPLLGDWLFAMRAPARLRAATSTNADAGTDVADTPDGVTGPPAAAPANEVEDLATVAAGELGRRGFLRAVLSSMRFMVHPRQEAAHRAIGKAGIPVVAIWGEADQVIPLRAVGTLSSWNRATKQEVVSGADHGLPHTHADAVSDLLRGILREDWE